MPTEFIDAGRLSTELILEARSSVPDGYGGFDEAWGEIAAVWARLEPVSSASPIWAGRTLDEVTHRVTIRFRDDVAAGMRFTKGARCFLVRTVVDPDERGRYLVCLTREEKS